MSTLIEDKQNTEQRFVMENDLMNHIIRSDSLNSIYQGCYDWLKNDTDSQINVCFFRCTLNDNQVNTFKSIPLFNCPELEDKKEWIQINSFLHNNQAVGKISIEGSRYKKYPVFGRQSGTLGIVLIHHPEDYTPDTLLWDKVVLATKFLTLGIERFYQAGQRDEQEIGQSYSYLEQAPAAIVIYQGPDLVIKYANEMSKVILGNRKIIGLPIREAMPEVSGQGLFEILDSVYNKGESFEATAREVRVENQGEKPKVIYLDIVLRPILDNRGKVKGIFSLSIDVTGNVRSHQQMEQSKQQFHLLADAMPDQVWMADAAGKMTYVNHAVTEQTGLPEESFFDGAWIAAIHPDDRQNNIDEWQKAVETGQNFNFEHRLLMANGGYRWQFSQAIPQRDADGEIVGWLGTSTDITKHKKQNIRLQETIDAQVANLKAANESLKQKNSELSSFAYVASHDLQEPLRKIETFSNLLLKKEKENLTEKGSEYLMRMHDASGRMRRLINDILQYSRISSSKDQESWVNLNETLSEVKEHQSQRIIESQATLRATRLPTVKMIPVQALQLFNNIISNALKYSQPDVPPIVKVSSQLTFDPTIEGKVVSGNFNLITIKDNGIGFDNSYAKKIFKVFERLHGKNDYTGTGIGLALCKRIVENHDGYITSESAGLNKGATFKIYLPQRSHAD